MQDSTAVHKFSSNHPLLQIPAASLLNLDRLKLRLEIAGTETLVVVALNDLSAARTVTGMTQQKFMVIIIMFSRKSSKKKLFSPFCPARTGGSVSSACWSPPPRRPGSTRPEWRTPVVRVFSH